MLRRWIESWEHAIWTDDADQRRSQPFGWGLEELDGLLPERLRELPPRRALLALARQLCADSESFYQAPPIADAALAGQRLRFTSPLPPRYPEVARASARLFESSRARGRAVIVIPQWNADEDSHLRACKILNAAGMTALRLTLPYHEERRPAAMLRADPMVSPILGLTLQAVRRAVLEVRQLVDWLWQRGYRQIGLLGSSLGSCIGFLALTHEPRLVAAAFNHVAATFADVVWTGLATRHIRASLEPHVDLPTLRECWGPISPGLFVSRLVASAPGLLMISGAYDPTFLPQHSRALVAALRAHDLDFRRIVLPCGHYTLGRPPFYLIDAFLVAAFLRRRLS
ncbi:MAG: alpha/beta hydrolase family protein [Acidobacteriota bacterium]